jgi:hypothetical protein
VTPNVDAIEEANAWSRAAVEECLLVWERIGLRFARRLRDRDRVRDAVEDVMTLAARRLVALRRRVVRPLPCEGLEPIELAFNTLDPADRYALSRLTLLSGGRARGEHLASALSRLLVAQESLQAAQATLSAAHQAHAGAHQAHGSAAESGVRPGRGNPARSAAAAGRSDEPPERSKDNNTQAPDKSTARRRSPAAGGAVRLRD